MKRNPKSGITQLELMISLIIMTMVTVLVANAFDFNRRSLTTSEYLSAETSYLLNQHAYRKWLEDLPLDYDGRSGLEYFEGGVEALRFRASPKDDIFPSENPTEFTLELSRHGPRTDLTVTAIEVHSSNNPPEKPSSRTLDTNVVNFSISYFGRIGREQKERWHANWHDPTFVPDLVKLEWDTEKGPRPPLTIVPGLFERQRFMSRSSLVPPG